MIFLFALSLVCLSPERTFPTTDVATLAAGKWHRPRAMVTGTVSFVRDEEDKDKHIRLKVGSDFIVAEIVPELSMVPPKRGDHIKVWGIVRYDGMHDWWEIHPVIGWKKE